MLFCVDNFYYVHTKKNPILTKTQQIAGNYCKIFIAKTVIVKKKDGLYLTY